MTLTIAAAQSASVPGAVSRNVAHHMKFAAQAALSGVQFLVFPELSLTGYELTLARANAILPTNPLLEPLHRFATEAVMTIAAGAPVPDDSGALRIAALVFAPDAPVSVHTKVHVHESELHVFTPGAGGPLLRLGEANAALAICADASHPQHAAHAAAQGANLYAAGVMITDNAYHRKTALMRNYAASHRMAVLMANYSGISGGDPSAGKSIIWDENGCVIAASADAGECLVIANRAGAVWSGAVHPASR